MLLNTQFACADVGSYNGKSLVGQFVGNLSTRLESVDVSLLGLLGLAFTGPTGLSPVVFVSYMLLFYVLFWLLLLG